MTMPLRKLATFTIYPIFVLVGMGVALAGEREGLPVHQVMFAVTAAGAVLVTLLERTVVYTADWNRSHGDVRTDLVHAALSNALPMWLFRGVLLGAFASAAVWLSRKTGTTLWPTAWPLAAQVALGLLVGEFFNYWFHRWMHLSDLGWRFHAVHHSAPRLYWVNGLRIHPVDFLCVFTLHQAPVILLGASEAVVVLIAGFIGLHGMLEHSNVDLRLGPLNWIVNSPELHRWHHSRTLVESNTNYGNNLIVWDVVFGTRFLPAHRTPPVETGLAGISSFPGGYLGQLFAPFHWSEIKRGAAGGADLAKPPLAAPHG